MKKRWYKNSGVKTIAVLLSIVFLTMAASGAAAAAGIICKGVHPLDKGSYLESRSFQGSMQQYAFEVLHALEEKSLIYPEKGNGVIDLVEISDGRELTYKNTSGLAYKISDLIEWVKQPDWKQYKNDVLVCVKPDGTLEYMHYLDFEKKVRSGEWGFQTDDLATQALLGNLEDQNYLGYGYYDGEEDYFATNIGILNSGATGVFDQDGELVYRNVINEYLDTAIVEAYSPIGAKDVLEVVNEEPYWKGRLKDAYQALDTALTRVKAAVASEKMLEENYAEGKSNLGYFLVTNPGKSNEHIETNSENGNYENMRKTLKKGAAPYIIMTTDADENESNMKHMDAAHFSYWRHMIENAAFNDRAVDYVFAAWVDPEFPVKDDLMAEDAEDYQLYMKWMMPSIQFFIIGVLGFLVCLILLTMGAGWNNNEEEIQLNFFDRWYTEIGAIFVLGIWAAPIFFILMALGINVDFVEKLKWLVLLAAAAGVWTAVWFLIGWLSLVRRIKGKIFWKNLLIRKIVVVTVDILRKIFRKITGTCGKVIVFFSENTTGRIKMAILFTGFCFLQFVICAVIFCGGVILLPVLAALDLLGLIYFLKKARGRELILNGLKRITDGELQYKIPLDSLTGEQKRIAEYINRIGDGLDAAVEKSMKNERMKTELITNVSHDIKTPLTSIINYVDLLKRENPQDPKIQGYLDILEEKSQRLKTLTEDVVEASKASTGNISLEMADLNFVELIHQVIGEFEERFQEKKLMMMVHFDQEEAIICADGRRMWRVLENVFSNISKYAMENTRVYAEVLVKGKKVIFSLKNISAQPLNISAEELTERFIRGDVSRNTEGSGLGLSIAKSLTELQGGEFKIHVDGDLFKVMIVFAVKEKTPNQDEKDVKEV